MSESPDRGPARHNPFHFSAYARHIARLAGHARTRLTTKRSAWAAETPAVQDCTLSESNMRRAARTGLPRGFTRRAGRTGTRAAAPPTSLISSTLHKIAMPPPHAAKIVVPLVCGMVHRAYSEQCCQSPNGQRLTPRCPDGVSKSICTSSSGDCSDVRALRRGDGVVVCPRRRAWPHTQQTRPATCKS